MEKEIISIVGTGMIGCSLAASLGSQWHIVGVDVSSDKLNYALEKGYIHEILSLEKAAAISNLVVVSAPADVSLKLIHQLLDAAGDHTVVMDFCSTKQTICQSLVNHRHRSRYVAAHPMAGSEKIGPQNAVTNLFLGKRIAICESERSSDIALKEASKLIEELHMFPSFLTAEQHDQIMAEVSHLPQVAAFCLANTAGYSNHALGWAGSGFESTTRLAGSDVAIWTPILLQNSVNVTQGIRRLIENLEATLVALETSNANALKTIILNANAIQKKVEFAKQTNH